MEKIHSKLRRTDYYDFDHGLTLMNVLFKTEDGKLDRIDTYIGVEGNEFVCVGCAKDLSAPGGQSQILCKRRNAVQIEQNLFKAEVAQAAAALFSK